MPVPGEGRLRRRRSCGIPHSLGGAKAHRRRPRVAGALFFVGEFGAYSKADEASRITFNRTMRDAIEARGMSWTYWEFASGFGVYDPGARAFRQPLLESLLGR